MNRNIEIDRLRALAVIGTMYSHIPDLWLWKIPLLEFLRKFTAGYDGVLLFFAISGFVISASLVPKLDRSLQTRGETSKVLTAFFCKRLFRITPTATLWILFTLVTVSIIDPAYTRGNIYAALASLLNVFNLYATTPGVLPNHYGIYWSLSLEEQFYLALPLILIFIRTFKGRMLALACLVAITELTTDRIRVSFQIPPIIAGVALFLLEHKFGIIEKFKNTRLSQKSVLIPAATLLAISIFTIPLLRPMTHYMLVITPSCVLLVFIALLGKNAVLPTRYGRIALDWLGSRSFTLYLSHFPMILFVRSCWIIGGPHMGISYSQAHSFYIFLTWMIATLMVTELSYRLVEKPMMKKGRTIAGDIESGKLRLPWSVGREENKGNPNASA